jgi:hypothetical protein
MPALLINDEIYGNTPSGIEERVSADENAIEETKEIKIGVISPVQNIEINGVSWVKKSNNVVSINFASKATELVTGWQGMASIPKEFAPPSNMYFSGSLGGLSSVQIVLTSNGAILTSNDIAKDTGIYFAVSYIV